MSVRIRLSRVGKGAKKKPFFRVSVMERRHSRDGRVLENIGIYDPRKESFLFKINKEKFAAWVKKGAQVSETVAQLIKKGLK